MRQFLTIHLLQTERRPKNCAPVGLRLAPSTRSRGTTTAYTSLRRVPPPPPPPHPPPPSFFTRVTNVHFDHNAEPYTWPLVANISRVVLGARYSLLPYYYTLFYQAHINGTTVARPLFFEFPRDPVCFGLDTQFLIGSWLMISPVLQQGATSVTAYLPAGVWYDFWTYQPVSNGGGKHLTLDTPIDHIQVRSAPLQEPCCDTHRWGFRCTFGEVESFPFNGRR